MFTAVDETFRNLQEDEETRRLVLLTYTTKSITLQNSRVPIKTDHYNSITNVEEDNEETFRHLER